MKLNLNCLAIDALSHIPLPEGVGQRHDQRAAQDEAERMAVDQQELLPEGMVEDVDLCLEFTGSYAFYTWMRAAFFEAAGLVCIFWLLYW